MPEDNLKNISKKSAKLIITRELAPVWHILNYNGFSGENDCLKCQRKKLTAQREEVHGSKSTALQNSIENEIEY